MDRSAISLLPAWLSCQSHESMVAPQSLHVAARRAAEEHKWLESQKVGRDLGQSAILDWYRHHWRSFCRHRRLEHLGGVKKWIEFNDESFGQMSAIPKLIPNPMLDPSTVGIVFNKLAEGCENLIIIDWAHGNFLKSCRNRVDAIVELLTIIDINSARIDPRLDEPLASALGSRC